MTVTSNGGIGNGGGPLKGRRIRRMELDELRRADEVAACDAQSQVPLSGSILDLLTASIFSFLYYENFRTQSSILQYIYIGHHRGHYVASSCTLLLHNELSFPRH